MIKKILSKCKFGLIALSLGLVACGSSGDKASDKGSAEKVSTENVPITVISREEGSGTRGAFVELVKIEEKNSEGKKIDNTTDNSEITNSTSVMITTVSGDKNSIGYVSLGSLNDSVQAIEIDGATPNVENVKTGEYKISRPFNIVTQDSINEVSQDFIDFILSANGQDIVEKNGYISKENTGTFETKMPNGKIMVVGSSSVFPVMEKLKEAYMEINKEANIEIQQNDSTTGVTATIEGVADIGMVSRNLKESEASLTPYVIALDGIVVINNKENPVKSLSSEQVKQIFKGEITSWSELK